MYISWRLRYIFIFVIYISQLASTEGSFEFGYDQTEYDQDSEEQDTNHFSTKGNSSCYM